MAAAQVLEVDKEGHIKLQVQATSLPTGVTLVGSPAPTIQAQRKRLGRGDASWELAPGVTIDQIAIVDRIDRRRLPTVVVLAEDQALQFRWQKDPDPQPDETDEPVPTREYRVVAVARRSDGAYDWVGKFDVVINP